MSTTAEIGFKPRDTNFSLSQSGLSVLTISFIKQLPKVKHPCLGSFLIDVLIKCFVD